MNNNVDMIGFGGGIGLSGQLGTGWFTKHIESNDGTNDSVETTPSFIKVAFPKSGSTYPFGLNDKRWIAGTYSDSAGVLHGFIAMSQTEIDALAHDFQQIMSNVGRNVLPDHVASER